MVFYFDFLFDFIDMFFKNISKGFADLGPLRHF